MSAFLKCHYADVIMTTIASQITSLTVVYSTVYSDADQRKHQSSASLAFVWGFHRDRWIPRTKGQLRGKCFHLMTSSWLSPHDCLWLDEAAFAQWLYTVTWSPLLLQWNMSVTTTSKINFITCDLFSNVFNEDWRYQFTLANNVCLLELI